MNVMTIIKNELKLMIRDKVNLIILLTVPIAMIGLMGYALKPFFTAEEKGIKQFELLYANYDNGYMGKSMDEFMKGEGSKYFKLVPPDSEDMEGELASKNIDEAVIIPKGLTDKLLAGEESYIVYLSSGKNTISNSVVKSFLDSFRDEINTSMTIEAAVKKYGLSTQEVSKIQAKLTGNLGTSFVNTKELGSNGSTKLGSFQYYSVSMLIFFLLTSGMGLGIGIVNDRAEKIYSRISSYPVTRSQYLLGKALGNGIIGILQAAIIIAFTSLVFKVNWGNNYLGIGIAVIAVLFSSSGLAVILSSRLNSSKALSTALIIIYWAITFISGAFAPVPAFEGIGRFTMNKWAFEAITSFMAGKGFAAAAGYLAMLLSLCLILWVTGIMLYKRRASYE